MIRSMLAFAFAAALFAAPAQAQEEWRHEASGISLPRAIGEHRLTVQEDASGGGNFDVILQYGVPGIAVTVYVYRSAYPSPAMWFERTRLAMNENIGSGSRDAAPRSFTLGGASAANGLREEIDLAGGRTTGVAIAQIGEWMVKLRVTSNRLDRAALRERMDAILAAFRFARPTPAPLPLVVPGPCGSESALRGNQIRNGDEETAAAALFVIVGDADARGEHGLAAEPALWCRATTAGLPVRYGTVYRRRDGTGWVALLGDSGRAAAAGAIDLPGRVRSALYASTPSSTSVVALYDGVPDPDQGIMAALPVVAGQARGISEMSVRPGGDDE